MKLTNSQELLTRRKEEINKIVKENNVLEVLKYILSYSNTEKFISLSNMLEFRNSLIDKIELDHRWLYTVDGFINLSDFVSDVDNITFVVNFIPRGENGFGYDPIFFVPEIGKTTAEISDEEKNAISHRGKALRSMLARLKES